MKPYDFEEHLKNYNIAKAKDYVETQAFWIGFITGLFGTVVASLIIWFMVGVEPHTDRDGIRYVEYEGRIYREMDEYKKPWE